MTYLLNTHTSKQSIQHLCNNSEWFSESISISKRFSGKTTLNEKHYFYVFLLIWLKLNGYCSVLRTQSERFLEYLVHGVSV